MRITRWDQQVDSNVSNEVLFHLARQHALTIGESKEAQEIRALIGASDFKGLCCYELGLPSCSISEYASMRQIIAFFSKRVDLDIDVDRKAVAWNKFVEAEQLCRESNELFRKYNRGGFFFLPRVESVLFRAQRKIAYVLGDVPSLSDLKLRFGPGATTQVKKREASARRKLAQRFCCSEEALRFLPELLAEMPVWADLAVDTDQGTVHDVSIHCGVVDFARKNAKTDRTIGKEPMLNSMVQLGLGSVIAERLRPEGIDIRDQSRNQRLAREGSITGELATLDLQSASGTISKCFVESLLPYEWWDMLRSFRTEAVSSPDGIIRLEQFSSMGNGFTFPLQTLIFYALAHSCCQPEDHQKISVYGDDIIVPTYAVPLLIEVLTACGFLVNQGKSYWTGPFRESCGKDYLSGIDVRPCFIKGALSGHTCFVLHNHYVRTGQPGLAAVVLEFIDESLRLYGPDGYGDGHLLGECYLQPHGRDRGWGGYTFETYTYKSVRAFYRLGADYVFPSYSIYMKDELSNDPAAKPDHVRLDNGLNQSPVKGLFLRRRRRISGDFRPERVDAVYAKHDGKTFLTDTLPGVRGYKRIKIYITQPA